MILKGRARVFGDDVNTDYIIAARHRSQTTDLKDLVQHIMEDIRPGFYESVRPGDIITGGHNFGCGSSREHAPYLLKEAGIGCIVAASFARIFYRNCINLGLPAVICDTAEIAEGDQLKVDLDEGVLYNLTQGWERKTGRLPQIMQKILREGGVLNYISRHGDFEVKGS